MTAPEEMAEIVGTGIGTTGIETGTIETRTESGGPPEIVTPCPLQTKTETTIPGEEEPALAPLLHLRLMISQCRGSLVAVQVAGAPQVRRIPGEESKTCNSDTIVGNVAIIDNIYSMLTTLPYEALFCLKLKFGRI